MHALRVALLNASYNDEATARNFDRDVRAEVHSFAVDEGDLPETYDYDAVIVSGSGASVYGDEPWIPPLLEWVDEAIDRDLPVLGVCFGHQLLAHVLGGRVEPMGEYEIGYREIERVGDSQLLSSLPDRFLAFTTHSDEVTKLPPGAELTAENDYSIHGFRAGHVFGVQFHPEYDRATAERITREKDLPEERIAAVLDGITEENVVTAADAKVLFDNFLGYVEALSAERPTNESRA
ncbi:type 1 glutamine amidotransferase [Natronosalvus halobius]|uniref:type 1 glutamine amidotransferase n=1 Tax=Natronosalvus halobius TaxID=2953746 RepID=UPI0020A1D684|nr:type 1 glutamine amidotransferase [Natronosalvus halobius]USZ72435.1 type 1 glutamine amidotransferase [Natronosalvus halobius]